MFFKAVLQKMLVFFGEKGYDRGCNFQNERAAKRMATDSLSATRDFHDKERNLDWLTACVPILVISFIYYRWSVVLLALPAVAGYLAVGCLLQRWNLLSRKVLPALTAGVWLTFFLPASAPLWMGAVAGGVAACVAALPALLSRRWEDKPFARPLLQPLAAGVLAVRLLFPATMEAGTMPVQWAAADAAAGPSSLAGLFDPSVSVERWRLFFGIYPSSLGGGCSAAVLLALGYLLLRRRVRLVPVACMLATVSLLSLAVWGSPLYALLAGWTLLGAILLGDTAVTPAHYGTQAAVGVLAGMLTVVLRAAVHADGAVTAALVSCAAAPLLGWLGGHLRRLWRWMIPYFKRFWNILKRKLQKSENNS